MPILPKRTGGCLPRAGLTPALGVSTLNSSSGATLRAWRRSVLCGLSLLAARRGGLEAATTPAVAAAAGARPLPIPPCRAAGDRRRTGAAPALRASTKRLVPVATPSVRRSGVLRGRSQLVGRRRGTEAATTPAVTVAAGARPLPIPSGRAPGDATRAALASPAWRREVPCGSSLLTARRRGAEAATTPAATAADGARPLPISPGRAIGDGTRAGAPPAWGDSIT